MHKTSRHFLRTSGFYTQHLVFKIRKKSMHLSNPHCANAFSGLDKCIHFFLISNGKSVLLLL